MLPTLQWQQGASQTNIKGIGETRGITCTAVSIRSTVIRESERTCGIEINYRRLRSNSHVQIHTNSEVLSVSGEAGNFKVKIRKNPTFVNEKCVACDHCTAVCPSDRLNDFNEGMDKT